MFWPVACALLFLVFCTNSVSGVGVVSLSNTNFAGLQFSRLSLFPPTSLVLSIVGDSFNATAGSAELLANSVVGPGWSNALLSHTDVSFSSFVDNVTLYARVATLVVTPDENFAGEGTFQISIPANATRSRTAPAGVNFTITQGRRSPQGRVATFIVLLGAGVAVLAALLGSTFPLLLVQCLAVVSAPTCGPVPVQEEFAVVQYVLIPFDFAPVVGTGGLSRNSRLLLVGIFVAFVAVLFEVVRYVLEEKLVCHDATYEVDSFGLPLRSVNAGLVPPPPAPLVSPAQSPPPSPRPGAQQPQTAPTTLVLDDVPMLQDSEPSFVVAPADVSARQSMSEYPGSPETNHEPNRSGLAAAPHGMPTDARWATAAGRVHDYRGTPIPPHYCYVVLIGLTLGMTLVSVHTGFSSNSSVIFSAVSIGCLLTFTLGCIGLSMTVTRDPKLFWCAYSTHRGNIPSVMQPSGVWGPNAFRERFAPFLCTWRKGCKGVSPFIYLLLSITALLAGVQPRNRSSALLQMGLMAFVTGLVLLLCVTLQPFRSRLANISQSLVIACVFINAVLQSVFISSGAFADPTYAAGQLSTEGLAFFATMGTGAVAVVMLSFAEVIIRIWEVRRGRERRAGRDGERLRRERLLVGTARASKVEQQRFQATVKELMEEVVVRFSKKGGDDDNDNRNMSPNGGVSGGNGSVGGRSSPRARMRSTSLWRPGQLDLVATDANPPSLAEYLVQDFDAIPLETREEMLNMEWEGASARRGATRLPPKYDAAKQDSLDELLKRREFLHHKSTPCLATLSLEVDRRSTFTTRPNL